MIPAFVNCVIALWFLFVGAVGHSVIPVVDASVYMGASELMVQADQLDIVGDRHCDLIVPGHVHEPGEHCWSAPALFFESEEELREQIDPKEDKDQIGSNSSSMGSLALRPLVYSIHDPSAVVGRGRHFNAAPPVHILLGVLRV